MRLTDRETGLALASPTLLTSATVDRLGAGAINPIVPDDEPSVGQFS
jgi:hypothetical protein